ncbi:hypothetical protein [Atopobium sp. oral taxon 416]|uniref:hypothetical protein n=1 Tax=Atopobium sp. oral taxon 416 TaxID=712157 RepID=UPI001BADDA5F|nr:hypothetical protein [Atopobium sp. oral taxon 416]QUC04654.1 hypothetical protein J4859_06975 [Atopobium sp. oral taxon 416]
MFELLPGIYAAQDAAALSIAASIGCCFVPHPMNHIATNYSLRARWVPSIIVFALTLNWCEQLVGPQIGHTNPCGNFSSISLCLLV